MTTKTTSYFKGTENVINMPKSPKPKLQILV